MSIVLVRHGETALNAARVLQPADTPLSARGEAQAAAVARRLAGLRPAALVSSDLPRARQTAEAIAATTGRPVDTTALLQERNFGALRGLPYDTLGFDPLAMEEAPAGGESIPAFRERVARAFAEVLARRATLAGTLVVVSHGLVIRALLEAHARLPAGVVLPERMGNASVTVLGAEAPFVVTLLNCTAHLEGAAADDAGSLAGV